MTQKTVSRKLELSNFFDSPYLKQCFYNIGEYGAIIVNANDPEQQTQQRWIQQEAANPQRGRFTTETPLERERQLEIQHEQRKRRRQQETA